jgi:hypothetical protein
MRLVGQHLEMAILIIIAEGANILIDAVLMKMSLGRNAGAKISTRQ